MHAAVAVRQEESKIAATRFTIGARSAVHVALLGFAKAAVSSD